MPNQTQPIFSILHTSARPDQWENVYQAWVDMAHDPASVEYVLVVDHDWRFTELPDFSRSQDKAVWQRGPRHCYVDGVNLAASHSTGKILIVNADDQYPCQDWDKRLLEVVNDLSDNFVILPSTGTPDEHTRRIAVMPILSRARYDKYGYVLYPLYESMFADNEFLAHARKDNAVIEAKHLMFPHRHPLCDPNPVKAWEQRDEAYRAQNRDQAFAIGSVVFQARQNSKFEEGSVNATTKPTMVICLPGETFAMEWVTQWTEILCQLSAFYQLKPIFTWSTNVYTTRETLAKAAMDSNADYIVWIDDDNLVAPGQIQQLIDIVNKGADIAAGWCWLQSEAYTVKDRVSCGWFSEERGEVYTYANLMSGDDDIVPVDWTGFPIVVMKGDVISRLPKHPFLPILSDAYAYGHAGEDVSFCYRAKQAGMKIFVDRTVKVPHLKRKPDEPAMVSNNTETTPSNSNQPSSNHELAPV